MDWKATPEQTQDCQQRAVVPKADTLTQLLRGHHIILIPCKLRHKHCAAVQQGLSVRPVGPNAGLPDTHLIGIDGLLLML